ncbi:MAG: M60 family metallopeptidase, partial [Planctomycetota bacterium]
AIACPAIQNSERNDSEHLRAELLTGVREIASPGVPGAFCVFGDAFVVAAGNAGAGAMAPVVAAANCGKGRIVAFGHGGYFESAGVADTGTLLSNAIRFAARNRSSAPEKLKIGILENKKICNDMKAFGYNIKNIAGEPLAESLAALDAFIVDPFNASDADVQVIQQYVENGGGLLVTGLGWGWLQLHPGKTLENYAANKLLAKAGILYSDETVSPNAGKLISTKEPLSELLQASRALDALLAAERNDSKPLAKNQTTQASFTLALAARTLLSKDTILRPRIAELLKSRGSAAAPSPAKPLTTKNALDRVLLIFEMREAENLPPRDVRAHASASAFPGSVPGEAPIVSKTISIDTNIRTWHSTGLYAKPGAIITIEPTMPQGAGNVKDLKIQIGCHTDDISAHAEWKRVPEIVRSFNLNEGKNEFASPFGGLIYIDSRAKAGLGSVKLQISGAVEAPYFKLGETTIAEWKANIRNRPAPWAELETSNIILTIPSSDIRALDDPEALMKFWDTIADGAAELYGVPKKRARAERFVTDVQISAGYMHSGYPIMTHLDAGPLLTNLERLKSSDAWGPYHELGHNHQEGDWTFAGTGEVTNNIYTVYAIETIAGANVNDGDRSPAKRSERIKKYIDGGRKFETWKSEPFLALDMYLQIKDAFGWDVYKKIFAEYRTLKRHERPKNDDEKRDQWMLRLSKTVNKNLGPFFDAWGVPVSEEAKKKISGLDAWMPDGFPALK